VNVFGTTNITSGIIDPTWECFIDGVSIGSTSPVPYAENNWLLCTWDNNGTSGSHVLTVNATSNGHPFYFDWLQYEPPQSASVQNAVVYLGNLDAAIKYDSSWQSRGDAANMTTKEESKVTVDFIGAYLFLLQYIQINNINRRHPTQLVRLHSICAPAQSFTSDIRTRRPDHPNHVHFKGLNLIQFSRILQPAIFPNAKVILFRTP
jgi:hypothetical protein